MLVMDASNKAARPMGAMLSDPVPLCGVVIDAVNSIPAVVDTLPHPSCTPTVRVVLNEGMDTPHYVGRAVTIRDMVYVMGKLAGSPTLKQYATP